MQTEEQKRDEENRKKFLEIAPQFLHCYRTKQYMKKKLSQEDEDSFFLGDPPPLDRETAPIGQSAKNFENLINKSIELLNKPNLRLSSSSQQINKPKGNKSWTSIGEIDGFFEGLNEETDNQVILPSIMIEKLRFGKAVKVNPNYTLSIEAKLSLSIKPDESKIINEILSAKECNFHPFIPKLLMVLGKLIYKSHLIFQIKEKLGFPFIEKELLFIYNGGFIDVFAEFHKEPPAFKQGIRQAIENNLIFYLKSNYSLRIFHAPFEALQNFVLRFYKIKEEDYEEKKTLYEEKITLYEEKLRKQPKLVDISAEFVFFFY